MVTARGASGVECVNCTVICRRGAMGGAKSVGGGGGPDERNSRNRGCRVSGQFGRSLAQVIVSPLSRGVLLKQPSLYKGMRSLILISYFCTKHRTFARKLSSTPSAWLAQTPANGAIIITTSQGRRVDRFERPPRAEFAVGGPNDDDDERVSDRTEHNCEVDI